MMETRPNITYATLIASRFANNLSYLHNKAVNTVFCYLKAIRNVGIMYKEEQRQDLTIKNYSNSNWACDHITIISTSGFIFSLKVELVSWYSNHQITMALSLTVAEYVTFTLVSKEKSWLKLLLIELGFFHPIEQYVKIMVAKKNARLSKIKSIF